MYKLPIFVVIFYRIMGKMTLSEYSKEYHAAKMYKEKDLLEYFYIARKFVQRKYGISLQGIELLLRLYPIGYFNLALYKTIDKNFLFMKPKKLIEMGYLEEIPTKSLGIKAKHKRNKHETTITYGQTEKFKNLIDDFYGLLSGEKEFIEDWDAVIWDKAKGTKAKTNRQKAMEGIYGFLNSKTPSENRKGYYNKK